MAREETNDFLAAFGIGAVLGIGAAFLLRGEAPDPRRRLLKKAKPHAKRLRRSAKQAKRAGVRSYAATAGLTDNAIDTGRELLEEFRGEVERILHEARRELHSLASRGHEPEALPDLPGGAESEG
jgi:gas vesicle protein